MIDRNVAGRRVRSFRCRLPLGRLLSDFPHVTACRALFPNGFQPLGEVTSWRERTSIG